MLYNLYMQLDYIALEVLTEGLNIYQKASTYDKRSQLIIITDSVVLLASIVSILEVRSNLSIKFYHPTTSLSQNLYVMQGNRWNCTTKYTKWTRCCTGKVYIFISEGNSILWFLKHASKYEIKQFTVHTFVNFPRRMVSTGSCRYLFACSTLRWDHLVYQAWSH